MEWPQKQRVTEYRTFNTVPCSASPAVSAPPAKLPATVKPGVVTGKALLDLLKYAKDNNFAIPAVNAVSSSAINACMEAAKKYRSPVMIQFSRGGGQFYAGQNS